MTLASNAPERRFGAADVSAAEELARRAALAIDNARLYREAQEAIRMRDEFLSVASHELNTPIASLQILAEGFEGGGEATPPAVFARIMSLISRQTRRLGTLVKDLLGVAHLSAETLRLNRAPADLATVVREAVEILGADFARAGSAISLTSEDGLVADVDQPRLHHAIANLLSNAIKFGPGKSIDVTVGRTGEDHARITVEDHGIGIEPERLPRIFDRFERAVSARHYGGLGLGLYLVRAIVEAHQGTVSVVSLPGEGSTFTIDLPLAGAASATG
jgi:signal transduction histidine kinase